MKLPGSLRQSTVWNFKRALDSARFFAAIADGANYSEGENEFGGAKCDHHN